MYIALKNTNGGVRILKTVSCHGKLNLVNVPCLSSAAVCALSCESFLHGAFTRRGCRHPVGSTLSI